MKISCIITFVCLSACPSWSQEKPPESKEAPPGSKFSEMAQMVIEANKKNEIEEAYKLAVKGAEQGDVDCQMFLGRMQENGWGTKADPAKALANYAAAAGKDHLEAKANWARCLEFGIGGKTELARADFLNQQGAEAGFPLCQSRMGVLEMDGIRRPADEKAALAWFEKAAAQGDGVAHFRLSKYYQYGLAGTEKNVGKALEHALKGANAGNLDSANLIGLYYQFGFGLNQDKIAAAGWFNFAAQYDHPAGLSNYGQCYEVGQGVKPNMKIAAQYYAESAKRNDPSGCLYLARCYLDGRGVEKNVVFAYVNFTRAVNLGLKEAEKLRDETKAKLKPAELKEAETLLKQITTAQP